MESINESGFFVFIITLLVIAVSPFVALYLGEWIASISPDNQRRYRISARAILVAISLTPLLMSIATAPAWAKDLLTLTSETTYGYDVIDSEIVQPEITLTKVPSAMELRLFGSSSRKTRLYRRSNVVELVITLDPGLRTSLTNRLIPIPGKIDWSQPNPGFKERKTIRETKVLTYRSMKEQASSLSKTDQGLPQTYISHSMTFPKPSPRPAVPPYLRDSDQQVLAQFLHVKPLPRPQTLLLPSSSPWDREYKPFSILLDVHELLGA